jgi:hypothetical protein
MAWRVSGRETRAFCGDIPLAVGDTGNGRDAPKELALDFGLNRERARKGGKE